MWIEAIEVYAGLWRGTPSNVKWVDGIKYFWVTGAERKE